MTGKAVARHGSMVIVSPSVNLRMCSWQVAVPVLGPVGLAVDHQPARAADALAAVAVERDGLARRSAMSCSLTTSSISRNDMSS